MRILDLEIHNFRGIKKAEIHFPENTRVICLIGAGDSTKTTVLKAIEWLLWDSWNLPANDNDFYNSDTSDAIVIRGTFTELPEKLLSEDKFGMYLRRPEVKYCDEDDEPIDEDYICVTLQLEIDSTLEPKWTVICNRLEPKTISQTDRKLLQSGSIGDNYGRDMVWGRNSILQRYIESQSTLRQAYTEALRETAARTELTSLDEIARVFVDVGEKYGVSFSDNINNKIIMQSGSFSSTVGVFDGKVPLAQRGKGSQRLLSIGLNISSFDKQALLLIDEIETGLEPYRLKSLIGELRDVCAESGQVIMTTHSPIALAECSIKEILIIHSNNGETSARSLYSGNRDVDNIFQSELRKNPEAFLTKRLIVCEGKTEMGFIRALDSFLHKRYRFRMASKGVGTANGGGDSIFDCAVRLINCGYDVCLLMDSDLPEKEEQKAAFRALCIKVFDWEQGNSIEEQFFYDASAAAVDKMVNIAVEEKDAKPVLEILHNLWIYPSESVDKLIIPPLDPDSRKKIGTASKRKKIEWFKRIDRGEQIGDAMFDEWDNISETSRFKSVVNGLTEWIREYDDRRTE